MTRSERYDFALQRLVRRITQNAKQAGETRPQKGGEPQGADQAGK